MSAPNFSERWERMTHESDKSSIIGRIYIASKCLRDRHGTDHSAIGARRSTLAQAVAHGGTVQFGQWQGISWHQPVSTGVTRVRVTLLVDVQSGKQTRRTHPQRREIH